MPSKTRMRATSRNDHESGKLRFCDMCKKPIASETAYKRHVAYCRRTLGKPKKRKRSCKHCHVAKSKCTFETPCARCAAKGLDCEYERPINEIQIATSPSSHTSASTEQQDTSMSEASEPSPASTADTAPTPSSINAELMANRQPHFAKLPEAVLKQLPPPARLPMPLPLLKPARKATEIHADSTQKVSAAILLDLFRALPQMMSKRDTLPLYIHGQWNRPELPSPVVQCVQLCQLFLQRDSIPDGRAVFLSKLSEERIRLVSQQATMGVYDLFACLQVYLIYNIIFALDSHPDCEGTFEMNGSMYDELQIFARRTFQQDKYLPFDIDAIGSPSETWDQFIYAESRRRCALFWFMASRVINVHDSIICPPIVGFRGLSLPAPDSLWQATTEEEWEAARAKIQMQGKPPPYGTLMRTFGELVEARSDPNNPTYAKQISEWLATSHKMGMTVLVASSMT
ncbi:hypothetical protein F5Y16DRAFT_394805 [Xylariaceae sp. FL0255]|nr:hypothetical protein F5Y16DRAFT_394805 [Xylariaceae sp. FL0255]